MKSKGKVEVIARRMAETVVINARYNMALYNYLIKFMHHAVLRDEFSDSTLLMYSYYLHGISLRDG